MSAFRLPRRAVRFLLIGTALIGAVLTFSPVSARADTPIVITMASDVEGISADGHSQANITVQAWLGQSHYSAPLQIQLRSSLGDLDPANLTLTNGSGWTHLRSGAASGNAIVTAQVANSPGPIVLPAPLEIAILPPGVRLPSGASRRFLSARADYLAYAVDLTRLVAVQHARLLFHGLHIDADSVSVDIAAMQLKAESLSAQPVVLEQGASKVSVRRVYVDFQTGMGYALAPNAEGALVTSTFSTSDLRLQPSGGALPEGIFNLDTLEGSALVIRARRMDVYPGSEIHCQGATIIVAGRRTLTLPFYRIPLNPFDPAGDQYVTYDTYTGLGINLPFYYMLRDNAMGSVRLIHQEKTGYFGSSTNAGWSLGVLQNYGHTSNGFGGAPASGGSLSLDRLTSQDWGFTWRHNQRLGGTGGVINSYFFSPDHQGLTGNLSFYMPVHRYGISLNTFGNHTNGFDSATSQFNLDLPQRSFLSHRMSVNLSESLAYQYVNSPGTGTSANLIPGTAANLYVQPWVLGHASQLTPSLSARYFWPSTGGYESTNLGMAYSRQLGLTGSLGITYNWSFSGRSGVNPGYSHHLISGYAYKQFGQRLRLSATPSYDLTLKSLYSTGSAAYALSPLWTLDAAGQLVTGSQYAFNDYELGISRAFLGRNLRLFYQGSTHQVRLEVVAGPLGY